MGREGPVRIQGNRGRVATTVASLAVILAACSGGGAASALPSAAAADPTADKLAQVQARGTLVLWTDPDYARSR
jgi:hypothetical protein